MKWNLTKKEKEEIVKKLQESYKELCRLGAWTNSKNFKKRLKAGEEIEIWQKNKRNSDIV